MSQDSSLHRILVVKENILADYEQAIGAPQRAVGLISLFILNIEAFLYFGDFYDSKKQNHSRNTTNS